MGSERPLKVAINAQLRPASGHGGVENVLIALVQALGQLHDDNTEYVIIGPYDHPDWLTPYLGPRQRIVPGPEPAERFVGRTPRLLRPFLARLHYILLQFVGRDMLYNPPVRLSNGFYESLGCDVIHFPFQQFTVCALPSVFNPHDLQHKHFPEFFTPKQIIEREMLYPIACSYAQAVAVGSQWVKDDVVAQYGLHPDKVQVIPLAPFSQPYAEPTPEVLAAVGRRYALGGPFVLYPAVTWPHKNHLRLLEALALLRDSSDVHVHLVCTGFLNDHFRTKIQPAVEAWRLGDQVRFLGVIPGEDLRALYRQAQFVISPSLFEEQSSMMFEAWQENTPVACGRVTAIPDQAGDAALLFDPNSVESVANAIKRLTDDGASRRRLVERGRKRLQDFSWERTARAYRALYRRVARRSLSTEEQELLAWDWMRYPHQPPGSQRM
jgi:glycosyltransferase involved in cell wall biosynthesis